MKGQFFYLHMFCLKNFRRRRHTVREDTIFFFLLHTIWIHVTVVHSAHSSASQCIALRTVRYIEMHKDRYYSTYEQPFHWEYYVWLRTFTTFILGCCFRYSFVKPERSEIRHQISYLPLTQHNRKLLKYKRLFENLSFWKLTSITEGDIGDFVMSSHLSLCCTVASLTVCLAEQAAAVKSKPGRAGEGGWSGWRVRGSGGVR